MIHACIVRNHALIITPAQYQQIANLMTADPQRLHDVRLIEIDVDELYRQRKHSPPPQHRQRDAND